MVSRLEAPYTAVSPNTTRIAATSARRRVSQRVSFTMGHGRTLVLGRSMLRPHHARARSHALHERPERRPALLVVLEHVVARARGRQQDGVARSRRPAGAEHHILEGRPTLERHLAAEIPLDPLARLAVRAHPTAPDCEERRQAGLRP